MLHIFNKILDWIYNLPIWVSVVSGILIFIAIFIYFLRTQYLENKKREKIKEDIKAKVQGLANNAVEMSPEEFMAMRKTTLGGRGNPSLALEHNFAGVYILYNKTKNMYYIGQAQLILNRVNAHFTGKGNGDVYADYKYGDSFTIRMIALSRSGFSSLNELERHIIMTYDAFAKGYNKTRGNK